MALGARVGSVSLPAVDRRTVLGGVLAAIAAFGVLYLTQPSERIPVLVAGSSLEAGKPLGTLDVDVRYVESADGLVIGDTIGELDGWSLRVPLAEGEPLVASLLQPPQLIATPNVIALSLPVENAVLGRLAPGDEVDVYVTSGDVFGDQPSTSLVASDVYVVEAVTSDASINRGRVNVLLAVDDDLAAKLAVASHTGEIDLVRLAP